MRCSQKIRKASFPLRRRVSQWVRPNLREGGPPSGTFSEEACVHSGDVEGGVAYSNQKTVAFPADSEIWEAGLGQGQYFDWPTVWSQRDDVFLAGRSLPHADEVGNVCLEAVYGPHSWADPVWKRKKKQPVRELSGDVTSIVSRWNEGQNFYHWFMDGLTRLVHLEKFPPNCRVLVPRGLPEFAKRSLELLGLSDRIVETGDEDLRIERYWFAGPTMLSGCPDSSGIHWLRSQFLRELQPTAGRLLYLERNAPTRNLINAGGVKRCFERQGWEVLDPGELDLDDQIRIFSEARAVVGVHGAALTNLLWVPPNAQVLEFMPSRRRNGCYCGISLIAGHSHQALVCPSNRHGDMMVPEDSISEWLAGRQ